MQNYTELAKKKLLSLIDTMSQNISSFVKNPGKDFTRERKLPFRKMLLMLISIGGNSIHKELLNFQKFEPGTATSAAFVQQRDKILPSAFEHLSHEFNRSFPNPEKFNGYRLLAVDGSDLHIPTNENDTDTYFQPKEGSRGYNLLHINALFDLCNKRYEDVLVQPLRQCGERKALNCLLDRSDIADKVIAVLDRGYEGYNTIAHIENKGWNYVMRIKDTNGIISKLKLPDTDEFDIDVSLLLTRKNTNEVILNPDKYRHLASNINFDFLGQDLAEYYPISFRVVRLKIEDDSYEVIATNLSRSEFPPKMLEEIYGKRWGIETSFRELKYSLGLVSLHSKKMEYILQGIYAKIIMYNFSMIITVNITFKPKDTKHEYQPNFVASVHICVHFLRNDNASWQDIDELIRQNVLPVRHGRKSKRKVRSRTVVSFNYRIA